jgi:signal transduction histidine kinase
MEIAHPDWRFTFETTGDLAGLWDPDRLLQVASNLLGNAGQHGRTGEPIVVQLDGTSSDEVRLDVRNAGAVPSAILTSVFDPFQATRRRGDRSRGLGLGLFIVRELVAAHGGTAEIESSPDADVTTVTIRLPRQARQETPPTPFASV